MMPKTQVGVRAKPNGVVPVTILGVALPRQTVGHDAS
jgi:hypothetical protein